MNSLQTHGPYQGVLQIVEFNSRKYLAVVAGITVGGFVWPFLPPFGHMVLLLGGVPALFWTVSSLIVSHYVYDRFPLYDFRQIARQLTTTPYRWINIHSGWDETSERLDEVFPGSNREVVDIFDARLMTEHSIQKARRSNRNAKLAIVAPHSALPFSAESFDAAFAIFAAHELRRHEQRVRLFQEVARVLCSCGEFVLIEHTRDWKNFLAFGPGFLHFFSQREWRATALEAGFYVRTELALTPFVHVYFFRRTV